MAEKIFLAAVVRVNFYFSQSLYGENYSAPPLSGKFYFSQPLYGENYSAPLLSWKFYFSQPLYGEKFIPRRRCRGKFHSAGCCSGKNYSEPLKHEKNIIPHRYCRKPYCFPKRAYIRYFRKFRRRKMFPYRRSVQEAKSGLSS